MIRALESSLKTIQEKVEMLLALCKYTYSDLQKLTKEFWTILAYFSTNSFAWKTCQLVEYKLNVELNSY
jgi:hypothetical protein